VVSIADNGVVPLPAAEGEYRAERQPSFRQDMRPISIAQPEGQSFTVEGNQVSWQKWSFRAGFTPREGLVLHELSFEDGGRRRPILHRASFSEMAVPYGDPSPNRYIQTPFDIGENLVGVLANSLELGCDCLGEIHYFDAVVSNSRGEPVRIPNASCLHEEDFGMLWKHTDFRTGASEVRRARRLVISFVATIGNYQYGNTVYEVESAAEPMGPDNPYGSAFYERRRLFGRESDATGSIDPLNGRYWLVTNPESRNRLGQPVAYKLVPGENVRSFAQPGSSLARRGAFAQHHVWIARYDPAERYAAGEYPNQHPGGDGLPAWIAKDRPLEGEDVVLWYTFGLHHIARPEDWPVMPVHHIGFKLKPVGFFDRNPTLDVPPPEGHDHCAHGS
jgi:primary-amine oxidase